MIWLTMAGGPSHLETFDPKPKLAEMHGKPMPESFTTGQQLAQLQGQKLVCFGPQHPFQKFGKNGTEICALFPHIGSVIDEICLVRSMTTEAINHDPAHMFMNTGSQIAGRPSMGAWVTYGLGSEAEDLPGFVVLTSLGKGGQNQPIAARQWSSGFLPSRTRACSCAARATRCSTSATPPGVIARAAGGRRRRDQRAQRASTTPSVHDPEIATRIAQYEMAFQMQASVPELMDIRGESREDARTLRLPAGRRLVRLELPARPPAGRARRAVHPALPQGLGPPRRREGGHRRSRPQEIDRACMALITDLKQRGMLDETLIVWAGEFGRTPMSQGGDGRDHHNKAMSVWLAGARHHAAAWSTARPTSWATPPSRTSAPSTTCTPRCCTSSASTTTPSASSSRASTRQADRRGRGRRVLQRHSRLNVKSVVAGVVAR